MEKIVFLYAHMRESVREFKLRLCWAEREVFVYVRNTLKNV